MTDPLTPEARDVVDTFVEAYPAYLMERVGAEITSHPEMQAATESGSEWLHDQLATLLGADFAAQPRGPLEVFQEAMRYPTEAMAELEVPVSVREQTERVVLPRDLYGLAPASSQDLGEEAWRAHVAWGIAKAHAVAGAVPARHTGLDTGVALIGGSPSDRELVKRVADERGLQSVLWRNPAAIAQGLDQSHQLLVLVDVNHTAAQDAIRDTAAAGVRVVAIGDDVNDFDQAAFQALGAESVIQRSRLRRELERLLPTLA